MPRAVPAKRPSQVFATTMREVRGRRRWSQEDLEDVLRSLGHPLDRTVIARIESEERKLTLDDAMAISAALAVAPIHMFTPRASSEAVAIGAKLRAPAGKVRRWVRGEQPLDETDDRTFWSEVSDEEIVERHRADFAYLNGMLNDLVESLMDSDRETAVDLLKIIERHVLKVLAKEAAK